MPVWSPSLRAISPSLWEAYSGMILRMNLRLSMMGFCGITRPCLRMALPRKAASKAALWATSIELSPQKRRKAERTGFMSGAFSTIWLVMLLTRVASSGMSLPGLTRLPYWPISRVTSLPSFFSKVNLTPAISMISSLSGSSPVVSTSNATMVTKGSKRPPGEGPSLLGKGRPRI